MRTTRDTPVHSDRIDDQHDDDGVHRLYIGFRKSVFLRTGRKRWILVDTGYRMRPS